MKTQSVKLIVIAALSIVWSFFAVLGIMHVATPQPDAIDVTLAYMDTVAGLRLDCEMKDVTIKELQSAVEAQDKALDEILKGL